MSIKQSLCYSVMNHTQDVKLELKGSLIKQVTSHKYLGVILDNRLDFSMHVDHSVGKAKRASAKVFSLIDGHQGISVQTGINIQDLSQTSFGICSASLGEY